VSLLAHLWPEGVINKLSAVALKVLTGISTGESIVTYIPAAIGSEVL
jgi:hypothetical protein